MSKRVLILNGSPKPESESACAFIEKWFTGSLRKKLFNVKKINIIQLIRSGGDKKVLIDMINDSDDIILISPLYLDSAPASVIKIMEFLYENKSLIKKPKNMMAVSVCGFPETLHNDTVLRIYNSFANDMGFMWLGGLPIGQGPGHVYAGKIFSALGFYNRLDKIISMAVQALWEEKVVAKEAIELTKISTIPDWFYTKIAILIAKILAIKDGTWNLYKRPYV